MGYKKFYNYGLLLICTILSTSCITSFSPSGLETQGGSLVIEGDIILNSDSKVFLSFSNALDDYNAISYLSNAQVWVESSIGEQYTGVVTFEANARPYYLVPTNNLNPAQQYKLCVHLSGQQYESDLLTPWIAPEIDSIEFVVDDTKTWVDFFVTSYGDAIDSRYYKWTFREDWEFTASYFTQYYYDPNVDKILPYPANPPIYYCWNQSESSSILIARTDHLHDNTVFRQKLLTIDNRSLKISYLYSMELYQMSISQEAYIYWSALKKNTEEIGGIFAPQPSEMHGNIHCMTDPGVKVLGYISAGTLAAKRIFASRQDIGIFIPYLCSFYVPVPDLIPPPTDKELYDMGYMVVKPDADTPHEWASRYCVDCNARGTKNKPSYWPNNHL